VLLAVGPAVRCVGYRRREWFLQNASHASAGDHLLDCNDPFGDSFLLNHDAARMQIRWWRRSNAERPLPVKQRAADKSRLVSSLTRVYATLPKMDRFTLSSNNSSAIIPEQHKVTEILVSVNTINLH